VGLWYCCDAKSRHTPRPRRVRELRCYSERQQNTADSRQSQQHDLESVGLSVDDLLALESQFQQGFGG
jgi:hypothetical protein